MSLEPKEELQKNTGIPLDYGWIESVRVNRPAVIRRVQTHLKRRSIKKRWQLAWLARCVACMDLTTLAGNDTWGNVNRLAHKAKTPIRQDLVEALGFSPSVGSVCVYPNRVPDAYEALEGSGVNVCSVAAGFPAGQTPMATKLEEIAAAVAAGAAEIDIVVSRELIIDSDWDGLYQQIAEFKAACGDQARLKAILSVGELPTFRDVYKASLVAMMAGADFIKTSTGKESVNATYANSLVMIRAVRDYYEQTGFMVGFKPAGGIRSAKQAMYYLALMYEELGPRWTFPDLFRIGASSLLRDIELQLEHGLTGSYAALNYTAKS